MRASTRLNLRCSGFGTFNAVPKRSSSEARLSTRATHQFCFRRSCLDTPSKSTLCPHRAFGEREGTDKNLLKRKRLVRLIFMDLRHCSVQYGLPFLLSAKPSIVASAKSKQFEGMQQNVVEQLFSSRALKPDLASSGSFSLLIRLIERDVLVCPYSALSRPVCSFVW